MVCCSYQIIVEGSVGVFRWTNCHFGEVKIIQGVSADRGGDGGGLPVRVGFADQQESAQEAKTYYDQPYCFCNLVLKYKRVTQFFFL